MTAGSPNISVCIPTYNRGPYLSEALESVYGQTLSDFEVIVYDDASTDDTTERMANLADGRVRFFRQPHNVGIARNRNSCLEVARGKYIAWLDSDDLYLPHLLATQSAVLDQHGNVGLVHGNFAVMDAKGDALPDWRQPFNCDTIEAGQDAFRELVLCNYVNGSTVMVRRACYERVGPYAVKLGNYSEDWEMWLRIALYADFAYSAAPVTRFRWHDQSISAATARAGKRTRAEVRIIERVLAQCANRTAEGRLLQRRARAAVAAKALLRSGEARLRGQRRTALGELACSLKAASWLLPSPHSWLLLGAIALGRENAAHRHAKFLLNRLYAQLAGTRYGNTLQKQVKWDPAWERQLNAVANTVRRLVPRHARVALVDKWDPTLLGLCRRKGWHFPDLETNPGGYPPDSQGAIAHLQQLMKRGAGYLVFPGPSFWWLDYYDGFKQYLDVCHRRIWSDELCIIYDLVND